MQFILIYSLNSHPLYITLHLSGNNTYKISPWVRQLANNLPKIKTIFIDSLPLVKRDRFFCFFFIIYSLIFSNKNLIFSFSE